MIPKIIHFCWFGRKRKPRLARKCIASWKKYFPDYEILEWNEDNFDVNIIQYTAEAYAAKKYAFVSDYARFWILYHYGGLYFDTDVELIKPIDDIVLTGNFMACEKGREVGEYSVNPGLGLGTEPFHHIYKELLDLYQTKMFRNDDGSHNTTTVVQYTTDLLASNGYCSNNELQQVSGIWVYPKEFFSPKNYFTGKIVITSNTVSIHHYMESWKSRWSRTKLVIQRIIGEKLTQIVVDIKYFLLGIINA